MESKDFDDLFEYLGYGLEANSQGDGSFYFRGHPDSGYFLAPAVFREKGIDEYTVYHEIFKEHNDKFLGMKPIDVLAKMQHYGVPTRLLDITTNPLVAAFFSVSDLGKGNPQEDKEAEILAFNPINGVRKMFNKVKNYDSDTVKLLSHLPLLTEDEKFRLRINALNSILISAFTGYLDIQSQCEFNSEFTFKERKEIYQALLKFILEPSNETLFTDKDDGRGLRIKDCYSGGKKECLISSKHGDDIKITCTDHSVLDISVLLENTDTKTLSTFLACNFWTQQDEPIITENLRFYKFEDLSRLYSQIQQNYPTFRECARPLDLLNGVFVTPIVNSDRMRAQQGAFMLFGLSRYWDITSCIRFLEDQGLSYGEIMQFIVEDKPLDDRSNLLYEHFYQNWKNLLENSQKSDDNFYNAIYLPMVKEFENAVFRAKRYKIESTNTKSAVIKKLDMMGINKRTLGCGMDTTYYNLLENNRKGDEKN